MPSISTKKHSLPYADQIPDSRQYSIPTPRPVFLNYGYTKLVCRFQTSLSEPILATPKATIAKSAAYFSFTDFPKSLLYFWLSPN